MMTNRTWIAIMKTPRIILSRSFILLSMLRMPLTRNTTDHENPTISKIVCTSEESINRTAVMGTKIDILYPYTQINCIIYFLPQLLIRSLRRFSPSGRWCMGSQSRSRKSKILQKSTKEAATGIWSKSYCLVESAKKLINELEATIITTRVLAIQNGPYKSGLLPTTCLKAGFSLIADITLSWISSSSTSNSFLHHLGLTWC